MDRDRGVHPPLPSTLAQLTDEAFLAVLFREGASSRARIAAVTGISKPTMSESAQRLLGAGILVEVGQSTGRRGRPMVVYDVNPGYGHSIGVALQRDHIAVRAVDYKGGLIAEYRREADDDDLMSSVDHARALLARCSGEAGSPRLATALSVAAPVDPVSSTARPIQGAPMGGAVGEFGPALGLSAVESLRVDNDVNWATLAESRAAGSPQVSDFLYVYVGAGIGAGLYLSGQLHRGSTGLAGEIGFVRAASGQTLMHRLGHSVLGAADGRSIDIERACRLLEAPVASSDVEAIVDDLAQAITNAAAVTDPGRIVLGGPLAQTRVIASLLTQRIAATALSPVEVAVSQLGRDAPLHGATTAALELAHEKRTLAAGTAIGNWSGVQR